MPSEPPDYYDLELELRSEEKLVRDTVREFVNEKVLPRVADGFMHERFPEDLIPEMAALGLLGATIQGYDCAGIGDVSYGLAMQELERGDSGLRSFVSVQGALAMNAIHSFGSDEQKEKWLPAMARGEKIGCFGLTEPDFGSDAGGMRTRAERRGSEYVLNGNKMWITNGSMADVAVVWAREEGRVRGFLVEKEAPGFSTTLQKGKWSLRMSVTSELHFQDCRIPVTNRLPGADGLKTALQCLNHARFGISWGVVGAAMACYTEALEYATTRIQFGKPIAAFQLVQERLVDMLARITHGQLMALRLGRLKEAGRARAQQISLAKRETVAMALDVAREARDLLGANGITHDYVVGRHMVNLETVKTYEGTHNIHTLIVGEDITGMGAFA